MEKKLLANAIAVATTAVAAAAFTVPVSAMDVYEDDDTKFGISGRLAVKIEGGGDETEVKDSSSRIRFAFEQDLTREVTASARAEWGFDPVSTSGSPLFNRLGSVSLAHDSAGKLSLGREWSASYDIAGWTDVLWVYGADGLGTYAENETSRATDSLIYRNSMAGFNISAQYGFYDEGVDRDNNFQLAAFYELGDMGLSVGAAYSTTETISADDQNATLLSAKYVNDMVYIAGAVGFFEDFDTDDGFTGDSMGYELVGFYYVPDSPFEIYGGYNLREADDNDAEVSYYSLGAAMKAANMVFALEGQLDKTDKDASGADSADDLVSLLVRYNF